MNQLLIASHMDLLIYDPSFLNSIAKKKGDRLYIFIPNIDGLESNLQIKKIIEKNKFNIIFITDVESNPNLSEKLYLKYKEFIIKKNIQQIFICNPIRLHCYICYLAVNSLKIKCIFSFYQGSGYPIDGSRDHKIYSIFNKCLGLRWLVKTKFTSKVSRLIYLIRKYNQILKIIKITFLNISNNYLNHFKILIKVLINQGVPIDFIVAHDKIGLSSILRDIPSSHNKNLRNDFLILSNQTREMESKNNIDFEAIYFLPSLIMDSSLTSKQTYSALEKWLELFDFIREINPNISIFAKLHPRCIQSFEKKIISCLIEKKIELISNKRTLDEFLSRDSLVLTDVSAVASYCQLNKIKAISYQTEVICGPLFYYFKLPAYFTDTISIIKSKESLKEYIRK